MRIRKEIDDQAEEALFLAEIADALAHPVRVAILKYVAEKNQVRNDVCNSDLVQYLDYSQATISQHVKKLVNVGLLKTKKQDKFTIYTMDKGKLKEFITLLKVFWLLEYK